MATAEVEELFRPTSASIRQLLSDHVGGFAIPSYQRPYRWQPADLRRLFEDLISGLERLVDDERAVTFIGAIITVSGVSETHHTKPQEARQVIDGQQRLTSLLMTAAAAHKRLGTYSEQATGVEPESDAEEAVLEWIIEQSLEVRSQLLSCLADVRVFGDERFKMLPKIIREIVDTWSNKQDKARYASPIAHLLHSYVVAESEGASFELTMPLVTINPEAPGAALEDHETIQRRFNQIDKLVRDVANGRDGDISERIDLEDLLKPYSKALTGLFDRVPEDLTPGLRSFMQRSPEIVPAVRLLMFSRFMLERVALTQINAKDEGYAFDLFDSLNSTGEPLTALETFVPLVVEAEGRDHYPFSKSYNHLSVTAKLLAENEGTVQRDTARLVTSFLLADCGLKVPNRHNDQRRELTRRYRSCETAAQRQAMTRQLSDASLAYFEVWKKGKVTLDPFAGDEMALADEPAFALRFARAINHTILIAPLARVLPRLRDDAGTLAEFQEYVKAMVAFSVLWRAAHGGTDGIDGEYRRLMQEGRPDIMSALARTPRDRHDERPLPSIGDFRTALKDVASSASPAFSSAEEWVSLVASRPIYDEQPELARFLLLVAAHHAIPDADTGLTKQGAQADHTDMLRPDRWDDERLNTVEHVAPQSPRLDEEGVTSWSTSLYTEPSIIHRLGNLTLVPLDDNASISNREWEEKRYLYSALSADSPDEASVILAEAASAGIDISSDLTEKIVERRRHLPLLQTLGRYSGDWDVEFVNLRSRQMLQRCWTLLHAWLE